MFNKNECALKLLCCSLTINFSEKIKHNERMDKMCVPSRHSLFFSKTQNFTVVPKRPFVFLQRNTKFYSCTQVAFRFFYNEMQNFENCTKTAIRFSQRNIKFRTAAKLPFMTRKDEIFKVVPKQWFAQNDFKNSSNKWTSLAKTFLEPSFLVKIVNDHKTLTIFAKSSIVDIRLCSKYASAASKVTHFEDIKTFHVVSAGIT